MKLFKTGLSFIFTAPLLFAISYILTFFTFNIGELYLRVLPFPIIAVAVFAVFLSLIFDRILKSKVKGNLFAAIFVILFFSYGEVVSLVGNFHFSAAGLGIEKNHVIFFLWVVLLLLSFFWIKRTTTNLLLPLRFLLMAAIFSTLVPLLKIVHYEVSQRLSLEVKSSLELPQVDSSSLKKLPDIYYIVPEDYSAPQIYQQYFNSDISDFTTFLKDKGFYVAEESTSNYPKSFLSIASTLNMEYLDYLAAHKNSSDQTIVNPLIDSNNVMRFLKSLGYKYYQMGSWWDPTHYNPFADENFILENANFRSIGEFNYAILKSSMIEPFIVKFLPPTVLGDSDADKRKRILYQFEEFPNIVNLAGPKFVFLHIIAPHGPYVFGKDCEFVTSRETKARSEEENYANQTVCINKKLELAIDGIIESDPHAVILLQTDEGAQFLGWKVSPGDSWGKADVNLLKEKFPIITAYYLPGVSKKTLYPSITPVNSFRIIFNLYFSTKLPLLPDKNYIFPNLKNLYKFSDVTDKVKIQN